MKFEASFYGGLLRLVFHVFQLKLIHVSNKGPDR